MQVNDIVVVKRVQVKSALSSLSVELDKERERWEEEEEEERKKRLFKSIDFSSYRP